MRFLIDENLSPKLVLALERHHPGSTHVDALGLRGAADATIWDAARDGGFAILTKDDDFSGMSVLYGAPPKVVCLRVGNLDTAAVASFVLSRIPAIAAFAADPDTSLLILP